MLKPRTPRRTGLLDLRAAPPVKGEAEPGTVVPNDQELSVSALAGALKRTIEDRFGYVRVRGEVSNYRGPHSSGHAYFSLKDEGARIDAVVWKTTMARLKVKPEEGLEVIASGKITTFPGKSAYQIVIESLEPAGVGALMAAVEERRRKLAAEGLFDAARKRPLPFLPGVIGVVTSPTGAVIRDILHRIADRFPRRVIVWPVRVQGEGSAAEVTRAVAGLNALLGHASIPSPHVIIVARGGGSLEDLWGFNDEALVRAVAASRVPLISAVGHETDWTLIDHAADLRAPTPTGAAELAVPVLLDLMARVDRLEGRLTTASLRVLDDRRATFRAMSRMLPSGSELLAQPQQRLDLVGSRLPAGLRAGVATRRLLLARLAGRLAAQAPQARVARMRLQVEALIHRLQRAERVGAEVRARRLATAGQRLETAFASRLRLAEQTLKARRTKLLTLDRRMVMALKMADQRRASRLLSLSQMLGTLGYRNVLARGFALVRDPDGHAVRAASGLLAGTALKLEFADGQVDVTVDPDSGTQPRAKPKRSVAPVPAARQGSLF